MSKRRLVALLSTLACAVSTPPAAAAPIQPAVDTPEQRNALRKLTSCIAESRPLWARNTLAYPYLSNDQARAAAEALTGKDNCLMTPKVEMTFRTSTLVGALAEHFIRASLANPNMPRLASSLATTKPLNVSEDLALCLASRNPRAAMDLALSEPGSAVEDQTASTIGGYLSTCTNPGEKLNVDLQSLRALVSTALYRGMSSAVAAR